MNNFISLMEIPRGEPPSGQMAGGSPLNIWRLTLRGSELGVKPGNAQPWVLTSVLSPCHQPNPNVTTPPRSPVSPKREPSGTGARRPLSFMVPWTGSERPNEVEAAIPRMRGSLVQGMAQWEAGESTAPSVHQACPAPQNPQLELLALDCLELHTTPNPSWLSESDSMINFSWYLPRFCPIMPSLPSSSSQSRLWSYAPPHHHRFTAPLTCFLATLENIPHIRPSSETPQGITE